MNDLIKSKLTFVDHQSEEKLLNYVWIYVELMFIIFEFYLMVVYRRIRKRVRRAKSNSEIRRDWNTFFKRWHINNRHCCWEKKPNMISTHQWRVSSFHIVHVLNSIYVSREREKDSCRLNCTCSLTAGSFIFICVTFTLHTYIHIHTS